MSGPRVVSLVPSWTETLVEAGAHVVGRTRFCVHPAAAVAKITAVGGTKDLNLETLAALKPDFIVLDREENTKQMFEALCKVPAKTFVSNVEDVRQMPSELARLATLFSGDGPNDKSVAAKLSSFADRFGQVLKTRRALHNDSSRFAYCIWKNPWMAVGQGTFIASMLEQSGYDLAHLWPAGRGKYPEFTLEELPRDVRMLLSSEPYPFAKKFPTEIPNEKELVDGESFSWFGIRALRYLEVLKSN